MGNLPYPTDTSYGPDYALSQLKEELSFCLKRFKFGQPNAFQHKTQSSVTDDKHSIWASKVAFHLSGGLADLTSQFNLKSNTSSQI